MSIELFFIIMFFAFIGELIDSSLGMGYGTLLSPVLILMGFSPLVVVPAILFSQAVGGLIAFIFHNKFKNLQFDKGSTDVKIFIIITILGILSVIFSVFLIINISVLYIKIYISILVLSMGILILLRSKFNFCWGKIGIIGIISAFNKTISGGGFGPVVTGGQVISGQNYKNSIGVTTLSEVPICLIAFICYWILHDQFLWILIFALLIGSVIAAPLGAYITKIIDIIKLRFCLAFLLIILGIWGIVKILI